MKPTKDLYASAREEMRVEFTSLFTEDKLHQEEFKVGILKLLS
jgi:hypothetical protein